MADAGVPHLESPPAHHEGRTLLVIEVLCLVFALLLLFFGANREAVSTLGVFFVSIVLEAMPFVVLVALVGGFIEAFVPQDKLSAIMPRRGLWTVLLAGLLGIIFPVCECAVIPVIRRLIRKGVPLAAAVTYLLAGPIVNPIVAASTAVAYNFDWTIVLVRVGCGYVIAVIVGLLVGTFLQRSALLPHVQQAAPQPDSNNECGCAAPSGMRLSSKIHLALDNAAADFLDIGRFLVLGAFFAGLIQTYVSRTSLLVLSETPAASIVVMMGMALALNLCSEADAFVAASFRVLLPLSAQMSFMVLGPMLDVKLIFMYMSVFRKRAIVAISSMVVVLVFVFMMLLQHFAVALEL